MSGMSGAMRMAFGVGATCSDCRWLGTGRFCDGAGPSDPACPVFEGRDGGAEPPASPAADAGGEIGGRDVR